MLPLICNYTVLNNSQCILHLLSLACNVVESHIERLSREELIGRLLDCVGGGLCQPAAHGDAGRLGAGVVLLVGAHLVAVGALLGPAIGAGWN